MSRAYFFPTLLITLLFVPLCLISCSAKLSNESGSLDMPDILDTSITHTSYKVSEREKVSTATPVVIAAHGYTATSYEWEEFLHYADGYIPETETYPMSNTPYTPSQNLYVSVVLLGGHGRSLETFRNATSEDWAQPIVDEYNALVAKGFTNISLMGASTGGTLILEKLRQGAFSLPPKHVIFIDSLVVPRNKMLHLVPYLSAIISDQKNEESTDKEKPNWYLTNPKEAMIQLERLLKNIQQHLASGISLPQSTQCHIYQSKKDPTVDPISSYLLYKGISQSNGQSPYFTPIDSSLHVFTRLQGRKDVTAQDRTNQKIVFDSIINKITN